MPIPPTVTPRLKLDRAKTRARLAGDPQLANATDAEIDNALASINQDALYDAERAKWTAEVWDRVSAINGVDAAHFFLARDDVPDTGDVYLVKDAAGAVVMFQPHDPDLDGLVAIPVGQGLTKGKGAADNIAADRVAVDVVAKVAASIRAARGLPPA